MEDELTEDVQRLAGRLRRFPGVVGVFWGQRRREGEWAKGEPLCLCVHVRWKRSEADLPESERLPPVFDGIPIDVIEVGAAKAHALDSTDRAHAFGQRDSAITAVAIRETGVVALFSGHGILHYRDRRIVRSFEGGEDAPVRVRDKLGGDYHGKILKGQIGHEQPYDWAVAHFDVEDDQVLAFHHTAGAETPLVLRRSPLQQAERLHHWSSIRDSYVSGRFRQTLVQPLELELPDGTAAFYTRVLVVNGTGVPFSVPGDSGSLVVDSANPRRVIGMIVGGSGSAPLSYVLTVHPLANRLGDLFTAFFR